MLITVCFMAILLRIVYINYSSFADVSGNRSGRTVVVGTTRGKIYDRNKALLVDTQSELKAAVTPIMAAYGYIDSVITADAFNEKVKNGSPFTVTLSEEVNNELVKTFSVPVRYSEKGLASHIVGYTDADGRGVTGIEKAFDELLEGYGGKLTVTFEADALGRVLAGTDKQIKNENFNSQGGVMLTLDRRIQELTEEAMEQSDIESGCAVVMHIDSGDIVALSSVPGFDRNNIEKSLTAEDSPLLNKALLSYSAGSVFKSIVAAFALENGISEEFSHTCQGSIDVNGKKYNCYGETAHGKLTMATALQKSCNTYFIRLMEALDSKEFLSFCRELGFGKGIKLCEGIESETGLLPDEISLSMEGNRANFSFGQKAGKAVPSPSHPAHSKDRKIRSPHTNNPGAPARVSDRQVASNRKQAAVDKLGNLHRHARVQRLSKANTPAE